MLQFLLFNFFSKLNYVNLKNVVKRIKLFFNFFKLLFQIKNYIIMFKILILIFGLFHFNVQTQVS